MFKLRLNNTHNQLRIHENTVETTTTAEWYFIRYLVWGSLVAAEQETGVHFHPWQIRQKSYGFLYVFVTRTYLLLRRVNMLDLGIVTTQHISYLYRWIFILRRLQDHFRLYTYIPAFGFKLSAKFLTLCTASIVLRNPLCTLTRTSMTKRFCRGEKFSWLKKLLFWNISARESNGKWRLTRDLKVLSSDFAVKITSDFDAKRRNQNQSNSTTDPTYLWPSNKRKQ